MSEDNRNSFDTFSDTSTIRSSFSYGNSDKSSRSGLFQYEIYRNKNFEINSEFGDDLEEDIIDDEIQHHYDTFRNSYVKFSRIELSPEAKERRREAYKKWFKVVSQREKEKKRLQQEEMEAERRRQIEREEIRKLENDAKVKAWNERKRREAQEKIRRLNEMKQASAEKVTETKEFKRAVPFEEWVAKKNEELKKIKARQAIEKEKIIDYVKTRENMSSTSYKNWIKTSKDAARPVPLNRGLESLRGTNSEIYINPNAWKSVCP